MIVIHEDGRIVHVLTTYPPDVETSLAESGQSHLKLPKAGEDIFSRWYVENGRMIERQPSGIKATYSMKVGEIISFPDLPALVVRFEGEPVDVAAGEFEFIAEGPGVFDLQVSCWPLLDAVTRITVT